MKNRRRCTRAWCSQLVSTVQAHRQMLRACANTNWVIELIWRSADTSVSLHTVWLHVTRLRVTGSLHLTILHETIILHVTRWDRCTWPDPYMWPDPYTWPDYIWSAWTWPDLYMWPDPYTRPDYTWLAWTWPDRSGRATLRDRHLLWMCERRAPGYRLKYKWKYHNGTRSRGVACDVWWAQRVHHRRSSPS